MKPKFSLFKSRKIEIGSSLVTAITLCFGSLAFAVDNLWTGAISSDWKTAGNWSLGRVPINPNGATTGDNFDDAVVNVKTPNIAKITADVPAPRDFRVGQGAGSNGQLDFISGSGSTGPGNWAFVGRDGGTGVFNLANTAGTGGTLTGLAQGSGSFTCSGSRLYVGGSNDAPDRSGNGTFLMNTTGTLTIGNDLAVGSGTGAIGVMKVDSGTITTGGWNFIGKNENGTGADGKLYMAGGTLTNTGRTYVGQEGSTGLLELTGGSYKNVNNEILVAGENAGSHGTITVNSAGSLLQAGGELWLGQFEGSATPNSTGVLNLMAGTVTVNNWFAIGRWGTGTVNQSGGTLTKTGGGSVTIANFGTAIGAYNLSGGLLDIQSGNLIVGEGGAGTASLVVTGGQINTPQVLIATGGSVVSTVSFNGGTLTTGVINGAGGGTSNVSFNGTQIVASGPQTAFITGLDSGTVDANGLKIDSNGKSIAFSQVLSGAGGLTKSGLGTLTVSGAQAFTGSNAINAGKLVVTTEFAGGGGFTVADGASLGVLSRFAGEQLTSSQLKLGTAAGATLDFDLGTDTGNATLAPLKATTLTLAGTVTINVTDAAPALGTIPLVQYGTKTGTNFVLGSLPLGVVATLVDNGAGLISLDVTSVALPLWQGKTGGGAVTGVWDVEVTQNWYDLASEQPSTFHNQSPALFDDSAAIDGGTTDVLLNSTVTPSSVTFNNTEAVPYTLTGTGKITGTGGLTNKGTGTVSIATNNDYTGVTTFQGGTTTVSVLTNGGIPSPLGAATASPSNLAFTGGTLSYTGPAATIDRGLMVSGVDNAVTSTLTLANNLTLTGAVTAPTFGRLVKAGTGTLTLANATNTLSVDGFRVAAGTVGLTGPGQTNTSGGLLSVGAGANLNLQDSTLTNVGDTDIGNNTGGVGTLNLIGASTYTSPNRVMLGVGGADTNGAVVIGGSSTLATGGWISVGQTGTGSMILKDSGKLTCGDLNITDLVGSKGSFTLQDSASVVSGATFFGKGAGSVGTATITGGTLTANGGVYVASGAHTVDGSTPPVETVPPSSGTVTQTGGTVNLSTDGGETQIGSRGVGVWNQSAGIINSRGWLVVGRYPDGGSSGTLNLSGTAILNQITANRFLIIGEETTGVVTVSGNAQLNALGDTGIMISNSATGIGTLNLDGGTVTTKGIRQGAGGSSTFNFNGGLLKAATGANANFFTGIGTATVKAAGAFIDTNGNNISFNQALLADGNGGLTKTGAGALNLNSSVDLTGVVSVNQGSLGGTGMITGPVLIKSGASLNPGEAVGTTLQVIGQVTFEDNSTLTIDAGAAGSDQLETLNLNVANAGLVVQGSLSLPVYPIATYSTLTGGAFKSVAGLPNNYSINYAYVDPNTNATQIALIRQGTPFDGWVSGYFPGVTDPATIGASADPDGDGRSNILEFALGGLPNSGADGPKVYNLLADTGDTGTEKELLMTIAIRGGSPPAVFTNGTATKDAVTYTIQGSLDLAGFASPVSEITPAVTTGLPGAPAGYEYRTFRLDASNGLGGKGFLRVKVTP